ncbi:MAG TPA: hypothetical protein VGV90_01560, partial [Solirubrobacteraceae bacterium]|nr:hypothetical protein [Solirubrobacteraceae bacterium]
MSGATFRRPAAVPPGGCFMMGASVQAMTTATGETPGAATGEIAAAAADPSTPSAPTAAATARRRKAAARKRSSGRRLFAHDRRLGV